MLQMLRKKNNKTSNSLVAYLLSNVKKYQDHVADLMTSSAEQRLARVLLRLAHLDKNGPAVVEIPILNHQVLAEMVGTTRPRVNLFMNRFRKRGFINYDGGLEVHQLVRGLVAAIRTFKFLAAFGKIRLFWKEITLQSVFNGEFS